MSQGFLYKFLFNEVIMSFKKIFFNKYLSLSYLLPTYKIMEARNYAHQNDLESFFGDHSSFKIHQNIFTNTGISAITNWFRYTGHMVPNHYDIKTNRDEVIGSITEENRGWIPFVFKSAFLKNRRPTHFTIKDSNQNVILTLYRPFRFLFSTLIVKDSEGQVLGSVSQRFSLFHKFYEFYTRGAKPFGFIKSSFVRLWTFPIMNNRKHPIGEIKKQWGGVAKESLTYADSFTIKWEYNVSLEQKIILFAGAISIDFDYFERSE